MEEILSDVSICAVLTGIRVPRRRRNRVVQARAAHSDYLTNTTTARTVEMSIASCLADSARGWEAILGSPSTANWWTRPVPVQRPLCQAPA
ncbi:hypothetical protein ACWEPL_21885 [Nonomuraea sp. NPDC004186]